MEKECCDVCGRNCDGVHNNKICGAEKEIRKIVKILESYNEVVVDEIIKQIYERRQWRKQNK